MSTGYQVIGPYVNGEVISATLFNNDFGAIAAAMHQTTGHDHDGTTGGGAPIAKIGDADFNNKIEIDGNFIKFSIEINGNASQQVLHISADGLFPSISGIDLGTVATPFDTANITTVNAGTVNASTEILVGHATNSTAETGSGASLTSSGVAYFTKDSTADDAAVVITRVDSSNGADEWLEFQKYISSTDSHQTLGSIKQYANSGLSITTPSSLLLNAAGSLYLNAGGATNNDIVFDGSYFRPVSQADGNIGLGSSSQKFSDLYLSGDIILKDDETDVSSQKIRFENDTNRYAEIRSTYSSDADGKGTGLIFATTADANDNGTPKDRLQITEGGDIIIREDGGNTGIFWDASAEKLGIGTIHPDSKLHVSGGITTMTHSGYGNKNLLELRNDTVPPNENTSASSVTMKFLASNSHVGSIIATGSKLNDSSTREFNFEANSAPISFNYNSSVISSIDGYGLKVSNTLSSGSVDTSIEGAILTPSGRAYITTDSSSTTSMVEFKRLTNVDDGRFLELRTGTSYIGSLQQGTSEVDSSRKSLNINSNTLGLRSANEISFFTDGATDERMRIEQDGNVVVYTTLEAVGNIVSRQPLAVTPSAPNASDVPTFILGNYNGYSSSSSTNAKIVKYNDGLSSHSVPNAYPLELIGSLGGVYDGVITLSPLSTAISNDLGPQHQITFLTESNYVGGVVTGYEDARIGIGEEFPKNHLVVKGSSNSTVEINASSDAIGEIIFTNPTNTDEGSIQYYNDTEKMYFSTANTQRIAIDADGQLGIGELSPSEALDVVGNIAVSGTVDGVDIDALNTTVSGKADLSGDTFTGLIEADGGLLIPETSRLEIGDNDFGGNNTFLSVDSNGVTAFYSYNNVVFQSAANLQLSGTGNSPLLKGNRDGSGNYEVSLHYGTGQERLITTSGGINVTGDITLTGTVDGIDIDALNTTVSGKADLSGDTFTGHVRLQDDVELRLGDNASGVGDLRIYHSSSTGSSFIKEQGSGGLIIQGESLILSDMSGKDYLYGIAGGETRLFHNGLEKFATRSGGVAVTGDIIVSGTVDGVDIDALNTTVTGKADLSGDTFTGLIEADGGLLIPETADLEIGPSAYGASNSDNTYLSVNSSGAATLAARNNFTIQSSNTLQLSGVGNRALLRGTMIDGDGNYEVSLFYGTSQEKLTTTSDGISVTGDITLTGAVGIGTDDPDYTLQIEAEPDLNNAGPQQYYDPLLHLKATGTETDSVLRMSTPALGECKIQFGDNIDDDIGQIEYKHSNNTMWFKASGSNVMKLQNNEVDVYGTLDVNGTVEAKDVIVYESQAAAVSPLLTTDRTVEELADLYALATTTALIPTQLPTYQHALVNFNATGETVTTLTSAEGPAVTAFVTDSNNNYTAAEQSDYYTYVGASPYVRQSTIIEDIERGDYDYLIAPAKVGINTETPASALDVIGDISVSGNITSDLGLNLTPTNGIEMRAGDANGIEMHWWTQSADASALSSEQTKRFHITSRGVHVGDDVTGTYTAGDNQTNQDIDFGFLVGRNSSNYGSNNVGLGYNLAFAVNSASNFAQGSIIDFYGATQNCAAFGGNLDVGTVTNTVGLEHSFIGGHIASTNANETFTWATGAVDGSTGAHYTAANNGQGSVLFGRQGQIDADSTYSLLGGRVGPATDFIEPSLINSSYAFSWGRGNVVDNSNASVVCGDLNSVDGAANALVAGESNTVLSSNAFVAGSGNETTAVDAATAIGKDNTAEGNYSVAIGKDNISLGEAGVCLGQGLKTSIFNQSVTNQPSGPYQWDNYTTVVGGYNNPSYKYLTDHTGSTTWVDNHRFVVGTGTNQFATDNGFIVAVPTSDFSGIIMPALAASTSHADDTAAKAAGVPVGGLYHTNGVVKVVL